MLPVQFGLTSSLRLSVVLVLALGTADRANATFFLPKRPADDPPPTLPSAAQYPDDFLPPRDESKLDSASIAGVLACLSEEEFSKASDFGEAVRRSELLTISDDSATFDAQRGYLSFQIISHQGSVMVMDRFTRVEHDDEGQVRRISRGVPGSLAETDFLMSERLILNQWTGELWFFGYGEITEGFSASDWSATYDKMSTVKYSCVRVQ